MKKFSLLCLLSSSLLMGGCTYLKDQFGLTHRTPDEFSVVKRAPLAIPPDLNEVSSLPAPQPGMQRPQEVSPQQSAQEAILKGPAATDTSGPSASENSLLAKAGATQDTTNIRETVDREAKENADKNRPVVKKIMNIGNKDDAGGAVIVDAPAEAERIKNKQSGETPSIEQ